MEDMPYVTEVRSPLRIFVIAVIPDSSPHSKRLFFFFSLSTEYGLGGDREARKGEGFSDFDVGLQSPLFGRKSAAEQSSLVTTKNPPLGAPFGHATILDQAGPCNPSETSQHAADADTRRRKRLRCGLLLT